MKNIRIRYLGQHYTINDTFTFSGGEIHVRLPEALLIILENAGASRDRSVEVFAHINASDDLMAFANVVYALHSADGGISVVAHIPYLPYARQDRVCSPGEANGLYMMGSILGALGLKSVIVYDVHSKEALKRINNLINIDKLSLLTGSMYGVTMCATADVFVAPDKGAAESVRLVADHFGKELIIADKVRDPATGDITGMKLPDDFSHDGIENKRLLVLDDICDGGRTFIEVAKLLIPVGPKDGPRSLDLYVTHGIFSKGLNELKKFYSAIHTANNINDITGVKTIWN